MLKIGYLYVYKVGKFKIIKWNWLILVVEFDSLIGNGEMLSDLLLVKF